MHSINNNKKCRVKKKIPEEIFSEGKRQCPILDPKTEEISFSILSPDYFLIFESGKFWVFTKLLILHQQAQSPSIAPPEYTSSPLIGKLTVTGGRNLSIALCTK